MATDSFGSTTAMSIAAVTALGAAAGGYLWLTSDHAPQKLSAFVNINKQTRILADKSRVVANLENNQLIPYAFEDAKTVSEAVRRGLRVSSSGKMLGYRKQQADGHAPYVWLTYKEVIERSENLARGFQQLGLQPGQDTFIGIFARNRPEWIICEHATYNNSSVLVPIYETLGRVACTFIVKQTNLQLIVVDDEKKANDVLESVPECKSVKFLVVIEPYSTSLEKRAREVGLVIWQLCDLESMGKTATEKNEFKLPSPEDLCTIAYTSGTTGQPKGAMITHGNVMACTTGLDFLRTFSFKDGEVMISYLPLAHMFERLLETAAFMCGMRVGYYGGDIKKLLEDIKELQPTIVPAVPRILNRLYDKVMSELNKSYIKRTIFTVAMASKMADIKRGIIRNTVWDKLVFKKIRDGFGGQVKLMITGSAPLAGQVLDFTRVVMGCVVLEGYGQTECVAECTLAMEADSSTGIVGIPVPCSKIKLIDAPELGYYANDEVGEICVKGYNVFKGYYMNEKTTKETLGEDGWLRTGDIGRWTSRGTLKIIDRKKHIFKLAQGEYIAPEKIEAIYTRSQFVSQVFVYGESLKACTIAVVVPDQEALMTLFAKIGLSGTFTSLCRDNKVKKAILEDMISIGKDAGLCSFEQVKDIHICTDAFTVENDLLTPTLKNKRVMLKQRFSKELASLYSKVS